MPPYIIGCAATLIHRKRSPFPGGEGNPLRRGHRMMDVEWDCLKTAPLPSLGGRWREAPDEGQPAKRAYSFACNWAKTCFLAHSQAKIPEPKAQAARWASR